jgi:hypothetical protein
MTVPTQYVTPDNDFSLSISQTRNDGAMAYSLKLKIDLNKWNNGNNLIDCLILTEVDPVNHFAEPDESFYAESTPNPLTI